MDSDLPRNYKLEKIDSMAKALALKPGDHIAWDRETSGNSCSSSMSGLGGFRYSHHAIVTGNDGTTLIIVEYAKQENDQNPTIHQKRLRLRDRYAMDYDHLYKIIYPLDVVLQNPPEEVLRRAKSKLGENAYDLFSNNCESFASYCKTGDSRSRQVGYRLGQGAMIAACGALIAVGIGLAAYAIADNKEKEKEKEKKKNQQHYRYY